MNLYISSPDHDPIILSPSLPAWYEGPVLPGSSVMSAASEFGNLLSQELIMDQYSIQYIVFQFFQKMTITGKSDQPGFVSRTMLKNGLRQQVKGIGKFQLRQGDFCLLYTPRRTCTSTFEKGKEYRLFDTLYTPELLEQLVPSFPQLGDYMARSKEERPALLARQERTKPRLLDIIYEILQCPFEQNMRRFYFDNKIREFLFLQLVQIFTETTVDKTISKREEASVEEARRIILGDIEEHHSIREISRKVGMNEFKLKSAFKKVTGTGMFECLLNARMEKARLLLLETDKPIKEIASLTGYKHITNFITAFRKHFGYTPGPFRNK